MTLAHSRETASESVGGQSSSHQAAARLQKRLEMMEAKRLPRLKIDVDRVAALCPAVAAAPLRQVFNELSAAVRELKRAAVTAGQISAPEFEALVTGYRSTVAKETERNAMSLGELGQIDGWAEVEPVAQELFRTKGEILEGLQEFIAAAEGLTEESGIETESPTAEWRIDGVMPQATAGKITHVVVLLHGIRTQGPWLEKVASVLRRIPGLEAFPLKYGYFDIARFLLPLGTRSGPAKLVEQNLRMIRMQHPDALVSVIAHSFGTYTIGRILFDCPDIRLDRLVLCGSVLPEAYPWARVSEQIRSRVLNECGTRDVWPLMAAGVTWGYGSSGTFGFGSFKVRDRFQPFKHSQFFDEHFVEKFWLPYLLYGQVLESPLETSRPTPPWWQSLVPHAKIAVLAILASLALLSTY